MGEIDEIIDIENGAPEMANAVDESDRIPSMESELGIPTGESSKNAVQESLQPASMESESPNSAFEIVAMFPSLVTRTQKAPIAMESEFPFFSAPKMAGPESETPTSESIPFFEATSKNITVSESDAPASMKTTVSESSSTPTIGSSQDSTPTDSGFLKSTASSNFGISDAIHSSVSQTIFNDSSTFASLMATVSQYANAASAASESPQNAFHFQHSDNGTEMGLIEIVRQYPELYDKTDKMYTNNVHKGILWTKIAETIGNTTAKRTREQFSYLRKRCRAEFEARKRIPESECKDDMRPPKFISEQLKFLEEAFEREFEAGILSDKSIKNLQEIFRQNCAMLGESSLPSGEVVSSELASAEASKVCVVETAEKIAGQKRKKKLASKGAPPPKRPHQSSNNSHDCENQTPLESASSATLPPTTTATESTTTLNEIWDFTKLFTDNKNPPKQFMASPPMASEELDEECKLFGRQISMDLKNLNPRFRIIARYEVNKIMMQLFLKQSENANGSNNL